MVKAARRYSRVVQAGTQNRSAPYVIHAAEYIRKGGLGAIPFCRVCNLKAGGPIRVPADSDVPAGVDYDKWLGPAPKRSFNRGHFHGGWYYRFEYCGGDMGNDASHQLDIARWLTGVRAPKTVHAVGGNLGFDDDRDVPDTQVATFEFDGMVMSFELTQYAPYMAKTNWQNRSGDSFPPWLQNATRIELYGTKQMMVLGRHGGGWEVYTSGMKVTDSMHGRFPDAPHKDDFVACIRSRKRPNADIEEGHLSAALSHMGNIAYRVGGRRLEFDAKTETFVGDPEANQLVRRECRVPYTFPDLS